MKRSILSLLRDKNTKTADFRMAADHLGTLLSYEVASILEEDVHPIETPLTSTTGYKIKQNVILIPILRAGLSLLYPFMKLFPSSSVGFAGIKRDEATALPHLYYKNLPPIKPTDAVLILDPMIATGGSGGLLIEMLKKLGVQEKNMIYAGVIAAPEGIESLKKAAPGMRVVCIEVDERLNDEKYIVPGLGDFGDRYFGT